MRRAAARVAIVSTFGVVLPAYAVDSCNSNPSALENGLNVEMRNANDLRSATVQDAMRALHIPSASVALIADGRIAWAKAYGDATTDTRYQAASLSKTVAAVAALRLVQEGRLGLDVDVNDALTSWKLPGDGARSGTVVTVRDLLNMTAGVGVPGYLGYARGAARPTTVQILDGRSPANSAPVRVQNAPGSSYAYSGGGYQIVQLMIEDLTGQPYAKAVEALVLRPVGMSSSAYDVSSLPESDDSVARGHYADGREIPGGWREIPELAAGGLWSTPTDFARLLISVSNSYAGRQPALLSQPLAQTMLARSNVGPYGLGVAIAGEGRDMVMMKRGQNVGYQAYMLMFPHTGDGIVIMTGSDNGAALETAIIRRAADACGWPALGPLAD